MLTVPNAGHICIQAECTCSVQQLPGSEWQSRQGTPQRQDGASPSECDQAVVCRLQETVLVIYSVDFPPSMHQSQFRSKHMEPAGHRTQQSLHWQLTLAAPTRWLRALLLVGQGLCSSVRQALGFADPAGSGSEGRAGVRQHGSQTASVKAWGRASLGMRIARVDRPSLLRVAHTACDKGLS